MPLTVVQAAATVEQPTGSLPSSAAATVTLPQATGTGNTLVAAVTTMGATTNPAVSGITLGGAADHWQAAVTDPGTVKYGGAIWFDAGAAAGQTSVVVSISGGTGASGEIYVAVYEVTGFLAFDQGAHGESASNVTTWSSGAAPTTTSPAEIFFGAATASNAIPTVTGAGTWTTQSSGAGALDQVAGYQIVSATQAAAFSGTLPGGGGGYTALVATFAVAVRNATSSPAVTPAGTASAGVAGAVHGAAVAAQNTSTAGVSGG